MNEKVLMIDTHNLCMRFIMGIPFDPTDVTYINYRSGIIKAIKNLARDFNPTKIIFCRESFDGNWRKNFYPEYKANRKEARDNSFIDFNKFFPMNDEFLAKLEQIFCNCQFIQLPHLEADDIIALTVKNKPDWDITLISTDKDFHQLHKYSNFKQWDPIKHQYIQIINPETALLEKIVRGDKGDNIPTLKRGIGPVTFSKILAKGLDEWLSMNELQEAYERNTKLISFNCIPHEFNAVVINALDSFVPQPFNGRELVNYVLSTSLGACMEDISECCNILKNMNKEN